MKDGPTAVDATPPLPIACYACWDRGTVTMFETCIMCIGSGQVHGYMHNGGEWVPVPCPLCGGERYCQRARPCPHCEAGRLRQ